MENITNAIKNAAKNRIYNALVCETFELAEKQALEAVKKGLTPFPIVIKDCFAVKDLPLTCASNMLKNFKAPYTATVVDRLFKNGGCIIGKGNMDEFAMGASSNDSIFGGVKNGFTKPEDLDNNWLIAGGSSGGSAVAVQLGIADVGIGSDTGGSSRNPAAFCGLVGFKPSFGALSRYGLVPLVNSLDCPSIIAKNVESTKNYFNMMRGICKHDSTSFDSSLKKNKREKNKLRVGIPIEYFPDSLTEEAKNAINIVANIFDSMGYEIKHISLPHTEYSIVCYHIINEVDVTSNMARYTGLFYGESTNYKINENILFANDWIANNRTQNFNETVKRRIFAGNYFTMKKQNRKHYIEALKVRRLIFNDFQNAFSNECDIILTPVTSSTPPSYKSYNEDKINCERKDDYFTQSANMAGIPAISLPAFKNQTNGISLSVQLMMNFDMDDTLLDVSKLLEKYLSSL
ncbi:Glutamyl-tRNA(Gln) amidotransferase subunit A, mitochondrial [Strongyloides ratti]|uniref:Glutamyl-tRNA(Gln) amidotransferase subunit A, mitochondrial n=1 Tax=Strongyloides ratti TaxID=34506 RepID=A0A090L7N5_STRRB|nr:Glutamyl-tRNA(Gln) amidotransferase subunit A, mitochondrial [Strongyloides ratti]CEF65727.1 Glutamyl-tRNA(Gln) amidotransferase subunit A, mitochondrial [Strongyloides ratti]